MRGPRLKQRCDEVLALVNLLDRAGEKPSTFSGGMKRRLNIACALMHDPQLLILDEPTVGVDPQSRSAIFDTLEQFKAMGRSPIYTSHYMEEVERLADHIVIIDHGQAFTDKRLKELEQGAATDLGNADHAALTDLLGSVEKFQGRPQATAARTGEAATGGLSMPFTTLDQQVRAGPQQQGYNGYAHSFAGMGVQFILFLGVDMGIGILPARAADGQFRPVSRGVRQNPGSGARHRLGAVVHVSRLGAEGEHDGADVLGD